MLLPGHIEVEIRYDQDHFECVSAMMARGSTQRFLRTADDLDIGAYQGCATALLPVIQHGFQRGPENERALWTPFPSEPG
jgi:hypothetical protein